MSMHALRKASAYITRSWNPEAQNHNLLRSAETIAQTQGPAHAGSKHMKIVLDENIAQAISETGAAVGTAG